MANWKPATAKEPHSTLLYDYCALVYRFRWWVVAFYALMSVFAAWAAFDLRSTMDNRVFFGPENPELVSLNALERDYSQNNDVLVALEFKNGGVFNPSGLAAIVKLTAELWKAPFATRVDSLANFQHSQGNENDIVISDLIPKSFTYTPSEIANVRSIALSEPLLKGLLISSDGKVTGARANFQFPRDDPASVQEIANYLATLQTRFQSEYPNAQLYFTGNVMVMQAFGEAQARDMMFLVPVMLVVMAGVLYLLLRSWVATGIALSVAGLSMLFAMGAASASGIVMSAGSAPAPFIVLTVALAYSVHLISEFVDACRLGASNRVSTLSAVDSNAFAIFLTSLTTAIGFLSMNSSDAPPFHDLGNISAIGVAAAFLLTFSLTPALLQIFSVPTDPKKSVTNAALKRVAATVNAKPGIILSGMAALVVVLAAGIFNMRQSENWIEYFDDSFQFRRDTDAVLQKLTGFDVLEFSVPATAYEGVESPTYLSKLDAFTVWLRSQPEVLNVTSISDIVKRVNRNVHSDDASFDRVPDDRSQTAQYLLLYEMSLPQGLSLNDRITVSRSASRVTVVVGKDGKNLPSDELIPLAKRFEDWLLTNSGPQMAADGTGLSLMFAHLSTRNIQMMIGGTSIAVVIVSLILVLGLRSFQLSLVSMVGDFVPAVMALGLWGHLVAEMNVAVSIVAAMTFGVVVDDTIHYVSKYARARRILGMLPDQAVEYAFTSTGKAMIFTMTVMCFGFAVLAFSSFGVNSTLGMLTVITFCFAMIADFFILAPLLLVCDRNLGLFAWQRERNTSGVGEHPTLRDRVDSYFDRMRDGHLIAGKVPGPSSVQLWSNDYLGLGGHPDIVKAHVELLEGRSEGVFMSAVFLNENSLQRHFEQQMSTYLDADAAVLCQSGWSANTGLVQALVDKRTPVYLDQFAHASLWEGARMAGASAHAFRHNQAEHLAKLIKRYGAGLILVDSIYSAYGTICPLAEITELSERTGCILAVDESHAIGVYGSHGEGLVHELGLNRRVQYRTFSLSKAFATRAGMVTGPERVMNYFPYDSRPAIFSSAVLQHEVAGLAATLKVIQQEDWRRERLWYNTRYLRRGLQSLGFAVDQSNSQIIALHSGNDAQTRALRSALEKHDVFGAVFCAPATPKNHGIVRLSVNARLRDIDLDRVINACRIIAEERTIAPWPKNLMAQRTNSAQDEPDQFPQPWEKPLSPGHILPVAGF